MCVHVAVAHALMVAVAQRVRYAARQDQRAAGAEAHLVRPLAAQQVLAGGLERQRLACSTCVGARVRR